MTTNQTQNHDLRASCDDDSIECAHEAARRQAETKVEELNTTLEAIGCVLTAVRDAEPLRFEVRYPNAETRHLEYRRQDMVQTLTDQLDFVLSGRDLGCAHKTQVEKLTAQLDDAQGRLSDACDRAMELEAEATS